MGQDQAGHAETGHRQTGIFLLDDHEIARRGVRELLETEPDITVVGEAVTPRWLGRCGRWPRAGRSWILRRPAG
jgi:hypothetical protein